MFIDLIYCFIFYVSINLFYKIFIEYNFESDLGIIWLYFEKDFFVVVFIGI